MSVGLAGWEACATREAVALGSDVNGRCDRNGGIIRAPRGWPCVRCPLRDHCHRSQFQDVPGGKSGYRMI